MHHQTLCGGNSVVSCRNRVFVNIRTPVRPIRFCPEIYNVGGRILSVPTWCVPCRRAGAAEFPGDLCKGVICFGLKAIGLQAKYTRRFPGVQEMPETFGTYHQSQIANLEDLSPPQSGRSPPEKERSEPAPGGRVRIFPAREEYRKERNLQRAYQRDGGTFSEGLIPAEKERGRTEEILRSLPPWGSPDREWRCVLPPAGQTGAASVHPGCR